jgi:DNA repair protein RecO (recombination protein O)
VTGFQPQLFACLECGEEIQPTPNFFSPGEGGVFCPTCGAGRPGCEPIEVDLLKVLRYLQSRPWAEVARLHVPAPLMRRIDNLMHRYLLHVTERSVRSVEFLRRMQTDPRFFPGAVD